MDTSTTPSRTAAATEATKLNHASIAARHPVKRERAMRIAAAGLVEGTITPAEIREAAERHARSRPPLDGDTLAWLRTMLPAPSTVDGAA